MVAFKRNNADHGVLLRHLLALDAEFVEELRRRTDVVEYANKLANLALNFEAWDDAELIGLVSVYDNDSSGRHAYITNISVHEKFQGKGIASALMKECLDYLRVNGFSSVGLQVSVLNRKALSMYHKLGFAQKSLLEKYWELELRL